MPSIQMYYLFRYIQKNHFSYNLINSFLAFHSLLKIYFFFTNLLNKLLITFLYSFNQENPQLFVYFLKFEFIY